MICKRCVLGLIAGNGVLSFEDYYRDTVMRLMRELDPDGVSRRRHHCLTRRIYLSKVYQYLKNKAFTRMILLTCN